MTPVSPFYYIHLFGQFYHWSVYPIQKKTNVRIRNCVSNRSTVHFPCTQAATIILKFIQTRRESGQLKPVNKCNHITAEIIIKCGKKLHPQLYCLVGSV